VSLKKNIGGFRGEVKMVVSRKALLGGGNSNIFHFHPENWGRFPFGLIFFKGVETTN